MDFSIELYREHLGEASFLYDQRGALFKDAEMTWPDLSDFEERFALHIEALVDGTETALQVARQQAAEGDAGELHAAVRLFCRNKRLDLIREVFSPLDTSDMERVLAISNALKNEWPSEWTGEIPALWDKMPEACLAVLPKVIGFNRLATMDRVLIDALSFAAAQHRYALVWSLGRIKARDAIGALATLLTQSDTDVAAGAVLALLRMGESIAADWVIDHCGPADFRRLLHLCLAGNARHVDALLGQLDDPACAADPAFALGVLGDIRAVAPLIQLIGDQTAGESAAFGLNLITGAGLFQDLFVPEEIDPDELFADEVERLKKGEPLHASGREPGSTIVGLSQDMDAWQGWWRNNCSSFTSGVRYRNGRPCSPLCLLENLKDHRSPSYIRQIAYEELVVRYGVDVPFETDMTVCDQLSAFQKLEARINQNKHRWKEGQWYFAGRVIG